MDIMPGDEPVPSFYQDILYHARVRSGASAVSRRGSDISYARFARDIERVTRRLAAADLPPHSRVAVDAGGLYRDWLVLIALMRLGHASVSVGAAEAALWKAAALVDSNPAAQASGVQTLHFNEEWLGAGSEALPAFRDVPHPPNALARLILSSGTTGRPKAVPIGFRQMRERWLVGAAMADAHAGTRFLNMLGLRSTGGFGGPLGVWHAGGTVILDKTERDGSYAQTLISAHANYVLGSPAQLRGLAREWPMGRLPEPDVVIHTGGSSLASDVNEAVRLRIGPRLYIRYGSTECGRMGLTSGALAQQRPGYVGISPAYAVVQVVDDQGRVLPAGETGQIRARSPGMATQYLDDPETTARHFIDGWFYPGDLGMKDEHGGLTLVGRSREIINLGGVKIAPERIDDALARHPGVKDLAAFSIRVGEHERLWVAVVMEEGASLDQKAFSAAYRQAFPNTGNPSVLLVDEVPRNAMGKALRQELQDTVTNNLAKGRIRPAST